MSQVVWNVKKGGGIRDGVLGGLLVAKTSGTR